MSVMSIFFTLAAVAAAHAFNTACHPLRSRARIAEHRRSWIVELISPRLDLLVVHSSLACTRRYPPVPRHMVFWPLLGMTETALALGGADHL